MTTTDRSPTPVPADYQQILSISAPPHAVFAALTDVQALGSWWTQRVTGDGGAGGELRFAFDGPDELVVRVETAAPSRLVRWEVSACPFLPDWVGTAPTFRIIASGPGSELHFHHHGLTAEVDCFE